MLARFAGLIGACLAASLLAAASAHAAEVKLFAGGGGSEVGHSVAIDGNTLVVGSPPTETVYVFTFSDGVWDETATLQADDGAPGDDFGRSVAIDGETIVVGAPRDDGADIEEGAVYTFDRTGDEFRTQTAKLTLADPEGDELFGQAVAIDGDTIVATAPREDLSGGSHGTFPNNHPHEGAAYTFDSTGDDRHETAQLTALDHAPGQLFGNAVAIDGNLILVGHEGHEGAAGAASPKEGAVYVFSRTGGDRTEASTLVAAVPQREAVFGSSVDIDGDTIVVGSENFTMAGSGAIYTFSREGVQTGALTAPDPHGSDNLGFAVAIEGDTIYAGAPFDDVDPAINQDEGSVEVFRRTGAGPWAWDSSLRAADEEPYDQFGISVAVDDGILAVGVPGDDVGFANERGSVWTFDDPVPVTLRVEKTGTGEGTVTSTPTGINCGPDCLRSYPRGSGVVLEATAADGSVFTGFSGAGCSTSPCTVSMTQANTVEAGFDVVAATPPANPPANPPSNPPGGSPADSAACEKAEKKLEKAAKKLKKLKQKGAAKAAIKKAKEKKKDAQAAVKDACKS